mmetsp:Transcript_49617/g.86693  ORF Transcript_49617/g.86693 Transcript_49617/m.86693 type:complete len:224 (-) Transcript_49617:6-677(-)
MTEFLFQGAEGRVFTTSFAGMPAVVKERLVKSYRVVELDKKINKQRLLQEARCIVKCRRAGVSAPSIYLVDLENNKLYMEQIIGKTLKDILWTHAKEGSEAGRETLIAIAKSVGAAIGKMHDAEIVHGDLTTSNLMVKDSGDSGVAPEVVVIDFGLGMMKPNQEDKAVDLYVLERAFISTHPGSEYLVQAILESYRFTSRKGSPTLGKLEQVRMRGRKRDMTG